MDDVVRGLLLFFVFCRQVGRTKGFLGAPPPTTLHHFAGGSGDRISALLRFKFFYPVVAIFSTTALAKHTLSLPFLPLPKSDRLCTRLSRPALYDLILLLLVLA